jgi:L-fuconolactonase
VVRMDAHHHLWDPARPHYPWMPADGPLRRVHLLGELERMRADTGVERTVVVQAAPALEESVFLMELALREARISGVVGWVELDRPTDAVAVDLDALGRLGPLVGVRPMLQDVADPDWLARPHVQAALALLARRGLVLDLLCREEQLPRAARALVAHPDLRVCVDHLAKPDYARVSARWLESMRLVAQRPYAYCKVSGLVTEVAPGASADAFRAHVAAAAETFGPSNLIYGSDWPVCQLAAEPGAVRDLADELTAAFDPAERERFWWLAAHECYRLSHDQRPIGRP